MWEHPGYKNVKVRAQTMDIDYPERDILSTNCQKIPKETGALCCDTTFIRKEGFGRSNGNQELGFRNPST